MKKRKTNHVEQLKKLAGAIPKDAEMMARARLSYRDGRNRPIDARTACLLRAVRECITILTEAHSDFDHDFESEKVKLARHVITLGELNFPVKDIARRLKIEVKQVQAILDRQVDLAAWVRR